MTIFKTYLKVLYKNKFMVILYTAILIFFAGFNIENNDSNKVFEASKPDILIVNQDTSNFTNHFIRYIKGHSIEVTIKDDENARNDALFYRDVNYIIYIPANFGQDFLAGKNPKLEIKSTKDYQASLAEMMINRYFKVANTYRNFIKEEDKFLTFMEDTLTKEVKIEMTSKLNTSKLVKASTFYNFANYSILAGCVFVICFIISSFKQEKIKKRTMISCMNEKKYNFELLVSNSLFALTLWILYVIISIILVGNVMLSMHGFFIILNAFVFTICALALSLFIGNLIHSKEAVSGLVNVIALGSSFLCGAFVPMEWLPDFVVKIAHILPSYYYIKNNDLIIKIEKINFDALIPILKNMGMLLLFTLLFIVCLNIITKKRSRV